MTRSPNLPHFDIFVIGGGINGAGIARDAVGRGYSVCLAEAHDFASGTSSASTKLIHGGLRYLEFYEFRLVREALREREVLWRMAPHIIRALRFVLPYHKGLRPAWMLRLGLFMYDHLGGRKLLPATKTVALDHGPLGAPLKPMFKKGFEYSDCWVEDARLVVLSLRDAADKGAEIRPRTRVIAAKRQEDGLWRIEMTGPTGTHEVVTAGLVVNAAGPWVDDVLASVFGESGVQNVRLVRGSHIVVPRKYDHDRAYIFQNSDGRIIFAIPYEHEFTLIGTTDVDQGHEVGARKISEDEINYLCDSASEYFIDPVRPQDVVWTYSGVRPLYDDGASKAQEATRDYVLKLQGEDGQGRILNVFGGKITTYRRLAESALDKIGGVLGVRGKPWTAHSTLPGGDFPVMDFNKVVEEYHREFPFLPHDLMHRLVHLYGTRTGVLLADATSFEHLGRDFGAGLYEAEIRYLIAHEWAHTAEDILYRRTKLGLHMTPAQRQAVASYMIETIKGSGDQPQRSGAEPGVQ